MENKFFRQEILEIILYIFIGLSLFVLFPTFSGFILKAFEPEIGGASFNISTYLGAFLIYFYLCIGALFLIIFPLARILLLRQGQHPALQSDPKWWTIFTVSLIHSPEENGALYRLFDNLGFKGKTNPMRWSLSILRVTILSILVFGLLGILQTSFPQLILSSVPQTSQQITLVSDIVFGAGVPAFTENGTMFILLFLLLGINAYICSRFKLGLLAYFTIALLLIVPLFSLLWGGIHGLVYGNSDVKFFSSMIFGFFGALVTILLASFIPFLIWHICNNLFIKVASASSSHPSLMPMIIVSWVVLLISYIGFEYWRISRKKKKDYNVIVPR